MKKVTWRMPIPDSNAVITFEADCETCDSIEYRENYAKSIGYDSWDQLVMECHDNHTYLNYHIQEVAEQYAIFKKALDTNMSAQDIDDLADENYEGCDGCTDMDEHMWKTGFVTGYNIALLNIMK